MDIHVQHRGDLTHVTISGELDLATAPAVRAAVAERLEPGRRIELDFTGVTFMDSTGARLLAWVASSARDCRATAVMTGTSPATHRLLRAARAEQLLVALQR